MSWAGSPLWLPAGFVAGLGCALLTGPVFFPLIVIDIVFGIVIFLIALSLPMLSWGRFVGDSRVWRAVLIMNLVVVPLLAFVVSRLLWRTPDLQLGLLLAFLAPGVALTIPIIRRAGGDVEGVLGITPLLLLGQLLLVPLFAIALTGGLFGVADIQATISPVAGVIVLPVIVAVIVQGAAKKSQRIARLGRSISQTSAAWTGLAFFLTSWSEASNRLDRLAELSWLIPLAIAFLVLVAPISVLVAGLVGTRVDQRRAVLISSVGRGGVVITPIAVALESDFWWLVGLAVMTQASVEALGLMVYRTISPELVPEN